MRRINRRGVGQGVFVIAWTHGIPIYVLRPAVSAKRRELIRMNYTIEDLPVVFQVSLALFILLAIAMLMGWNLGRIPTPVAFLMMVWGVILVVSANEIYEDVLPARLKIQFLTAGFAATILGSLRILATRVA